jgi:UDP-N-acetylmuramoyl-tripeptide--D-alanyl-D-alanine ligase
MMTLAEAANAMQGTLNGPDATITGIATDSRRMEHGALFFALTGPHFDGHEFVASAARNGARAAVVTQSVSAGLPEIVVADTRIALGRLAAYWRQKFSVAVVAVTGSNGKTTVKEMVAEIMSRVGPTVKTRGNLNNDIGVPLTLFQIGDDTRFAVVEMGANHVGEIAYLSNLAKPDVALVNNAMAAHLEGFGSIEDVVRAKGEIYGALEADGTAIVNLDDAHADAFLAMAAGHTIRTFALKKSADITVSGGRVDYEFQGDQCVTRFQIHTAAGDIDVSMPLLGEHNVCNALAATTAARAVGAAPEHIAAGLGAMTAVSGRLQVKRGIRGLRIVDDTYNANPSSVAAAITVLAAAGGQRLMVLGDMGELGADAVQLHAEAGERAKAAGVDILIGVGPLSKAAVDAFGDNGQHFPQLESLLSSLDDIFGKDHLEGKTVLIKGSRSMRMERVVEALAENPPNPVGNGRPVGYHRVSACALTE